MFDIALPRIIRTTMQGNAAQYEIEPLEPGYGVTIAHTLKRVLLSSLPGAAVTAIRVEGVHSAGQTIAGVKEDMMELILNVKQLRLRCSADHPVSLRLDVHGVCIVTGVHLLVPDAVEIINPDCHLATLEQEHAHLAVELMVKQGRGYVAVNPQTEPSLSVDIISIDALYTPVRKVNYTLEHTRVGKMVNFEKILLEVETDGRLSPDEALRQSGAILQQQFQVLADPHLALREQRRETQSHLLIPQKIYDMPLEALALSVRSSNALKRNASMTKVGHILTRDEEELRAIRNVGDKALMEIRDRLQATGCFPLIEQLHAQTGQVQQPAMTLSEKKEKT
jgi:DNA-directed RNA polymerase subunit alpha